MGFFSGIGKIFKSVAKVALPAVAAYATGGGSLLGGSGFSLSNLASAAKSYGPLLSGGLSYLGGIQTNAANSALAQRQMDFQERMSSTAYQRAMGDMREAGLNPMLAYQQGGASTPGGASATMTNALDSGVSSARQSQMVDAQVENLNSQNSYIQSNTKLNADLQAKAKADAILSVTSARKAAVDTATKAAELPAVQAGALANSSWMARQLNHVDRFLDTAGRFIPSSGSKNVYHHKVNP